MDNNEVPFISTTFGKDKTPISKILEICHNNGISKIELGSNHCYEENYIDIINKYNFEYLVHNYFPTPKKSFVINIASTNKLILESSLNHIFSSIDFCYNIGSKLYTFHPGFISDPSEPNSSNDKYDFVWDNKRLNNTNYLKSFDIMYSSIDKIINYSHKKNIRVAIETEGSFYKKNFLLMQKPDEYIKIMKIFDSKVLGINLNIGHLYLASKAFKFKIDDFVNLISKYILSFELSHNNGKDDQHLPLIDNAWYWNIILDKRFINTYKILEFRNIDINIVKKNIKLFENKTYGL